MDSKLSWRDHVNNIAGKVKQRLHILKYLAGSKWGSAPSTLNTTYKVYIKSLMKYSVGTFITASGQNIKNLEHSEKT